MTEDINHEGREVHTEGDLLIQRDGIIYARTDMINHFGYRVLTITSLRNSYKTSFFYT